MRNFGKIKNSFNEILINGIGKKGDESKKLFKQYIKTIKESEILRTQFLVYNNIENKAEGDYNFASLYITENLNLLKKFDPSLIQKENEKLSKLLTNLNEDYDLSKLHESLSNLIFAKKTPKNIENLVEDIKYVTNHVTSNKTKVVKEGIDLPISVLTKLMTEKYNERYDSLSEGDKKIIKSIVNSNFEDKKALYATTVTECIGLVDGLVKESDDDTKGRLIKVKEKLLEDKTSLNESDINAKFSKLIELKNSLV